MRLTLTVILAAVQLGLAGTALAANPEYALPEKVEYKHKACQEVQSIARKYAAGEIFSKDFEEGRQCLSRVELAASVELLTEKLAEKVVKEGSNAVARTDLDKLADIREELRAEMLLVGTRTFQQRNELLGTLLHPLTRNISLSGQLVGIFQSTVGYRKNPLTGERESDHSAFNGRGDLVFNFRVGESTIAVINMDALVGDGIDGSIGSFTGLNGVVDNSNEAKARFRQAWVEHSMLDDKLVTTIGVVDLGNYFDANTVANDENSQFLAGAFVNNHILGLPTKGPGARITATLNDALQFSIGYGSGDGSGNEFLRHGFGIAELDLKVKPGDLEGNYRIYGAADGVDRHNAYNAGISIDQQVTDKLIVFGRAGQRDPHVYPGSRSWSAGLQYTGLVPGRSEDVIGIAYGQISGTSIHGLSAREKLAEWYYRIKVSEKISVSPIAQHLMNPLGNRPADSVTTLGFRSQVSF